MKPEPVIKAPVETYLRRATRGLWGKKRLEVREELAAHLQERVMAYRIGGLGEADAVEKALSELGSPKEVSVGMARLYTLPTVAGSGIIFAALCVLTLAAWPHTVAQSVKSIFYLPTKACVSALEPDSKVPASQACSLDNGDIWLERGELVQTFRSQGVKVTGAETLRLTFPGDQSVRVQAGSPGNKKYNIKPAAPAYISFSMLIYEISKQSQLEISAEGWDNPRVRLGDTVIQLGSKTRLVPGDMFYNIYFGTLVATKIVPAIYNQSQTQVFQFNPRKDTSPEDYNAKEQTLKTVAKPGEVYGVIAILDPKLPVKLSSKYGADEETAALFADNPTLVSLLVDMTRIEKGGALELYLPEQPLQFVKSLGAHPKSGTAVLVKLSDSKNQQGYEVVSPEQVRYQALKYKAQN